MPLRTQSYVTLDAAGLRDWLAGRPELAARLGGPARDWCIREVRDGNLNLVFLIDGPQGGLCAKQALPHVRVAPDWKMPLDRALYEARYMRAVADAVGSAAPELYAFDAEMYLLVMESLDGHAVLRSALIDGAAKPGFSAAIGRYVARACAATGWIARPFEHGSRLLEEFSGNTALTRITVDLILTDPFRDGCPRNPAPEPGLTGEIAALRADAALLREVGALQERFLTAREALLHGDLHTGSIMIRESDVRVIDGEFATMGPIGFDCGLYLGNLLLHACAAPRKTAFLREEIAAFQAGFEAEFRARLTEGGGDVWPLLEGEERRKAIDASIARILRDTAGFCGLEMIRRTVGFAQVADYALCETPEARIEARARALRLGRALIRDHREISTFEGFLARLQ